MSGSQKHGQGLSLYVLLATVWLVAGCAKEEPKTMVPRLVAAQRIGAMPGLDQSGYAGEVRARYETDLGFRVGGKVVVRLVDTGAKVRKGQALAKLDPTDIALNVDAARSLVAAAEADFTYAKAELERNASLLDRKFISQAVYDGKLNAHNAAKARLEQSRAQYEVARNQAAYTTLHADHDGVVMSVNVEAGQVVAAGQAVMRVARLEEREVALSVPEGRISEFRKIRQFAVLTWANPGRQYPARLREISASADAATRTFAARLSVLGAGEELALGMTAVALAGAMADRSLIVLPLTAVLEKDGRSSVWRVDPASNKVSLVAVKVAQYREDGAVIAEGLTPGEIVVTAGVHKLLDGETVRLAPELAPAAPTGAAAPAAR